MNKELKQAINTIESVTGGAKRRRGRPAGSKAATVRKGNANKMALIGTKVVPKAKGTATQGVSYQIGGARRVSGALEYKIIPIIGGVPQLGGSFWSKAWNWIKRGASTLNRAAKQTKVLSTAAGMIPGLKGQVASAALRQAGYGKQAGGRIVKKGNALAAAR